MPLLLALALVACKPAPDADTAVVVGPDLTERLAAGQVRAGVITDDRALFGGVSAEGRIGDLKIYNDRVQFVIQGPRAGDFYLQQGGHVIDADIVRPPGQPGRDAVDEWFGNQGVGRVMDAALIEVTDDGATGLARIVASGPASAVELINGALEQDLITGLGLHISTEYLLEPDAWFLEVRTTVTADDAATILPGDILIGAPELLDPWQPGVGLHAPSRDEHAWVGYAAKRNDSALMIASHDGAPFGFVGLDLLTSLTGLIPAFGAAIAIPANDSVTWSRWYGVGPDLATLTDARLAALGVQTDTVDGVVTSPDGPVAGARVNVLVDGAPYTLAVTRDDGAFSAQVPAGSDATVLAVGRGPGLFPDHPAGAASYSPYAAQPASALTVSSLVDGAPAVALADGRGVADPDDPLFLGEPGAVVLRASDGLPFEARLRRADADPAVDGRLVPVRPHGYAALAWARDGEVGFPVEPGTYDLVVHRGIRYEAHSERVTVEAGGELTVVVDLPLAYEAPGYLLGDPHVHASPSADGKITMEDRLLVAAGVGLQMHIGTDHDHVADYRPLIEAMGLSHLLAGVVATEMSPVVRGHLNLYPLRVDPERSNNGAWPWWSAAERVPDTRAQFARLRENHPYPFAIQSNHPADGLLSFAGWSPGVIGSPAKWSDDLQAIEVNNGGGLGALPMYFDLVNHGMLVTPTSVSDSHGYLSGDPGLNATFFGMGASVPADYTDDAFLASILERRVIATRGPFLDLSIPPGSTVVGDQTLQVRALSPSWIVVDRLQLLRDGVVIETVQGAEATFTLTPEADASYVVVATGDTPMAPVWSRTPWAMSSAILVDVSGDGWEAPLGPLQVAE